MSYLKYKLEEEDKPTIDYRKLKRDKALNTIVHSIEQGWEHKGKQKSLLKEQKLVLKRYLAELLASNRSRLSIVQMVREIMIIAISIKKPFSQYIETDLKEYFADINIKGISNSTLSNRQVNLKMFFKWFYKDDNTIERDKKEVPRIVSWINIKKSDNTIQPTELVSYNEVLAMVNVATNSRDRFIPLALYETGCRAEEFININFKHITIEGEGENEVMYIDIEGKTGKRTVMCKYAIPYFKEFKRNHPYRNIPVAPVFVNIKAKRPHQITITGLYIIIRGLARTAGIKKKIYPHILRHSRCTELSQYMNESEMRIYFGWTKTSNMCSNYVHINNKNVKDKIKGLYGIKTDDSKIIRETIFKPKICCCGYNNTPTELYCVKCGRDISNEKQRKDFGEDILNKIVNNPELSKQFAELIKKVHSGV